MPSCLSSQPDSVLQGATLQKGRQKCNTMVLAKNASAELTLHPTLHRHSMSLGDRHAGHTSGRRRLRATSRGRRLRRQGFTGTCPMRCRSGRLTSSRNALQARAPGRHMLHPAPMGMSWHGLR